MKKQTALILCMLAAALTACSNADTSDTSGAVGEAASQSAVCESELSSQQVDTASEDAAYFVKYLPFYNSSNESEQYCYSITDEAQAQAVSEKLNEIVGLLSDDILVEIDPNQMHSSLESYSIYDETTHETYFITLNDIDGYNFSYGTDNYNVANEYIQPIVDIIAPNIGGAPNES